MKKLLFILSFLAIAFVSNAQFGTARTFPLVAGDTLVNVDTVQKIIVSTAGYAASGIQVNATATTGTFAATAYLFESLDGVNYKASDTATFVTNVASSYSTPSYAKTAMFKKVTTPAVYYRVWVVSTGTQSTPVQVLYTLRKYTWQ